MLATYKKVKKLLLAWLSIMIQWNNCTWHLAYTPPPGLTTFMSVLDHPLHIDYLVSLSVAVAFGHTPEQHQGHQEETPSLPHRSARTSSQ